MKLNSGLPFSLLRYGLPYNYPKLESELSTDVVIIGGGISGALCAWHLIEAGIDCIVVDKRTIGLGSTSASTSLLQYEIDVSLHDLINIRGQHDAIRAYQITNEALIELERLCKKIGFSNYHRTNSLYFSAEKKDEKRLMKECEMRQKIGLDVKFLTAHEVKNTFGMHAHGGILSSNAAHADAYSLTHALLQDAIKKGLQVFDRTHVTEITTRKDKYKLKTEDGVTITCSNIVYATGYEASKMLKRKIIELKSTYVTISESISDCESLPFHQTLLWNTADPYLYIRCTADGRIIIGGRDDNFASATKRDAAIEKKSKLLVKDFSKLFPKIPFQPEFNWAGTFGTTKDGLPFIGKQSSKDRTYFALGFGGNGIIFSMIAANLIRDCIKGAKNDDLAIFSFDRL